MNRTPNTIRLLALWVLAATIATPVFAQSNKDLSPDERQKQLIERSKTNKNHQLLMGLIGNWSFKGKHFPPDANSKPVEIMGTATRKAIMDGRYFICETMGGKLVMPWSDGKEVNYQDIVIEGYDNEKQRFFIVRAANHWGTGLATEEGIYDSTTKTFTYEIEMERGGEKRKFRDRLKIIDTDHYLFARYYINGDREIQVSESNYTRSGQ